MDTTQNLALVMGAVLVLIGISMLSRKNMRALINELERSPGFTWFAGVVTFVLGVISLELYHAWTSDWHVIITIISWLTIIKGAVLALAPNEIMRTYRKVGNKSFLATGGVIVIVIGAALVYLSVG